MSEYRKLTPKLHQRFFSPEKSHFVFYCPGCGRTHWYYVGPGFVHPRRWEFNGNIDLPSFTPSLRNSIQDVDEEGEPKVDQNGNPVMVTKCHLYVTAGKISYCGDCQHALNGQTVDMVDLPKDWED